MVIVHVRHEFASDCFAGVWFVGTADARTEDDGATVVSEISALRTHGNVLDKHSAESDCIGAACVFHIVQLL